MNRYTHPDATNLPIPTVNAKGCAKARLWVRLKIGYLVRVGSNPTTPIHES